MEGFGLFVTICGALSIAVAFMKLVEWMEGIR